MDQSSSWRSTRSECASTAARCARAVDFPDPGPPDNQTIPVAPGSNTDRISSSSNSVSPLAGEVTRGRTGARLGSSMGDSSIGARESETHDEIIVYDETPALADYEPIVTVSPDRRASGLGWS